MPAGWTAAAEGIGAAAAAASAGSSIAANNAAGRAANANNANNAVVSGAQNTMLNNATAVANQPFQAYTGTLTAPATANQQQASTMASQAATAGAPQADVNKGTAALDSMQPWNQATEQQYANPYTQDVTNAALAVQNKSYLQSIAGSDAQAGGTGSFGNARNAIQNADLTAQNTMNTATTTANNNAASYDSAMKAWQADSNTKIAASQAYNQAGGDLANMSSTQVADLMKTGGTQYAINQAGLSSAYDQFMRQQGWSANQLGPLISAVKGSSGGQQTAPVQSNTANQILGAASTIAGLAGGSSWGGSSSSLGGGATSNLLSNSDLNNIYSVGDSPPPPQSSLGP